MERNESNALEAIGIMHQATVIDVSPSISIQAAKLSHKLKLPMADSLIYATALQLEAVVWTQDADFCDLKSVRYIKK
jgi:predicted nuclease of predicted toxin-antitoxin system